MGDEKWNIDMVLRKIYVSYEDFTTYLRAKPSVMAREWLHKRVPPIESMWKINVDGSYNHVALCMGTEGLVRGSTRQWISGFSNFEGQGDALHAEYLAVKNGLRFAWDMGLREVMCESDCSEVIDTLHSNKPYDFNRYANIIHAIKIMLHRDWTVTFKHALREANFCADCLAKYGATQAENFKIWKEAPTAMGSLLLKDCLGT